MSFVIVDKNNLPLQSIAYGIMSTVSRQQSKLRKSIPSKNMTKETRRIPDWAIKERPGDLAWIRENLHGFWASATAAFDFVASSDFSVLTGAAYIIGIIVILAGAVLVANRDASES